MNRANEDFCHPPLTDAEKDVVVILQSLKQNQFSTNHSKQENNFHYKTMVKSLYSFFYSPLLWTLPSFSVSKNIQKRQFQEHLNREETVTVDDCFGICHNLERFLHHPMDCLKLPFIRRVDGGNVNYTFYQMSLPYEEQNDQLKWKNWSECDQNKQFPSHPRKVTYAMNNGRVYITINDIYNALEFRLEYLGFCVLDGSNLKTNMYSNLRPIKMHGMELYPSCPFLKALKKVGSAPMGRRQKCYIWSEVKHCRVFQRAAKYIFENRQLVDPIAVAVRYPATALMECRDEETFESMLAEVAPVWMP